MKFGKFIYSHFRTWIQKHATTFIVGVATTVGLTRLWSTVWTTGSNIFAASALSILASSGGYLYYIMSRRDNWDPKQVVVITGCDSGLGYSLALHCHANGTTVVAGVLQADGPAARNLSAEGIFVHHLDITDKESVAMFGDAVHTLIMQQNLVLKALVNNAGVMIFGEFEWQTMDQYIYQVEVNLLGTMRITKELLPLIRKYCARIIVISSHCAVEPLPGLAVYGLTKAGLMAWTIALRVELEKYGVNVVSFIPGSFVQESNLLSQQKKHFNAMKSSMTKEVKSFYGDYFTEYEQYLSMLAVQSPPRKLTNALIYSTFENALLSRYPLSSYKCEPWIYLIYNTLFKITPTCVRDRLVNKFMRMPSWKNSNKHSPKIANN